MLPMALDIWSVVLRFKKKWQKRHIQVGNQLHTYGAEDLYKPCPKQQIQLVPAPMNAMKYWEKLH